MVHRTGGTRGSYVIDRRFREVGRIRCASGTKQRATFRRVNDMLTAIHGMGRLDLLRAVRDGQVAPLELWDAYRVGALERVPSVQVLAQFREEIARLVASARVSDRARPRPRAPRDRAPSQRLRAHVLERDAFRCRRCGHGVEDGARLVIDHIHPFSKGGKTVPENLQALCVNCNAGKSDRLPTPRDLRTP